MKHNIPAHFTASGLVLCANHVLLVNHKRIGAWVPPGGHVEPNESPDETVVREVLEETGITVEIISEAIPQTGDKDAFFLPTPLCLQSVKATEGGKDYYHIDIVYLCRVPIANCDLRNGTADSLPAVKNNHEANAVAWIKLDDLGKMSLAKNVKEGLEIALNKAKLIPSLENV